MCKIRGHGWMERSVGKWDLDCTCKGVSGNVSNSSCILQGHIHLMVISPRLESNNAVACGCEDWRVPPPLPRYLQLPPNPPVTRLLPLPPPLQSHHPHRQHISARCEVIDWTPIHVPSHHVTNRHSTRPAHIKQVIFGVRGIRDIWKTPSSKVRPLVN